MNCLDRRTKDGVVSMLAVAALIGLTNCGIQADDDVGLRGEAQPHAQSRSAQVARRSGVAFAGFHIAAPYGDPLFGWVYLRVEVDDAAIRRTHPTFDGLETVYADIPGLGRRFLRYFGTTEGLDLHYAEASYQALGHVETDLARQGVSFGLWTNVGDLQDIARGTAMGPDIREVPRL